MKMEIENVKKAYDTSVKILCKRHGFRGRADGLSEIKMISPTTGIRILEAEKNLTDQSQLYFHYKKRIDRAMELWKVGLSKIKIKRKKGS